jgi:hypothetical protein
MRFDPWEDARTLAERLASPGARLVVVIGALAWCRKCRDILSAFEARAAEVPDECHVWLDLEEHAELIGAWTPHDLPLQLVYQDGRLQSSGLLTLQGPGLDLVATACEMPDPGVAVRLCRVDWAE